MSCEPGLLLRLRRAGARRSPRRRPARRTCAAASASSTASSSDLVAAVEQQDVDGAPLGIELGHRGRSGRAAPGRAVGLRRRDVAAYSELTAGEAYLPTAQDWTDLRRIAALVGFKPRPPIAAQGWVVAEHRERRRARSSPRARASRRRRSPGGAAQTFEVIADTPLRAEWAGLTATWVPQPAMPPTREASASSAIPGFRAADRILFVLEEQPQSLPQPQVDWLGFWGYLFELYVRLGLRAPATRAAARARHGRRDVGRARHDRRASSTATWTRCCRRPTDAVRRLPRGRDGVGGAPDQQGAPRRRTGSADAP